MFDKIKIDLLYTKLKSDSIISQSNNRINNNNNIYNDINYDLVNGLNYC
jgi:hypothetical protein